MLFFAACVVAMPALTPTAPDTKVMTITNCTVPACQEYVRRVNAGNRVSMDDVAWVVVSGVAGDWSGYSCLAIKAR